LFENAGPAKRRIVLRLVGMHENRCAIGALVRVEFVERGQTRSVWREVGPGASFGGNPLRLAIGLGDAERIVAVEIHWPRSGVVQRITDVPLDAALRVVEGQARPETFAMRAVRFGGK
jgi:hypothetical protein